MTVALPGGEDGVFSVIGYAFDAPSDERTVHVDRYGGEVVSTYGFDDYPVLAQVVSQGIGLHEGRSFGAWSMAGTTLMCLAIIFSCVTGPLMWWRRRPSRSGSMGAPRGRMPLRASPLLVVGLVALGVLLPLFGLSVLVVLAARPARGAAGAGAGRMVRCSMSDETDFADRFRAASRACDRTVFWRMTRPADDLARLAAACDGAGRSTSGTATARAAR